MDIPQRLALVQSGFLSALTDSKPTLESFQETLSTLVNDFEEALHRQHLDDSSIAKGRTLASGLEIIGERFLQLRRETGALTSNFSSELNDIFSCESLCEITPPPSPSHPGSA